MFVNSTEEFFLVPSQSSRKPSNPQMWRIKERAQDFQVFHITLYWKVTLLPYGKLLGVHHLFTNQDVLIHIVCFQYYLYCVLPSPFYPIVWVVVLLDGNRFNQGLFLNVTNFPHHQFTFQALKFPIWNISFTIDSHDNSNDDNNYILIGGCLS